MTLIPYTKNNKLYFIPQIASESSEHTYLRCNFIASQVPTTQESFDQATVYSYIYINNTLYGAVYNDDIMSKLEAMKKNLYIN